MLCACRLDPGHPFPCLPSGSLNIAVELRTTATVHTTESPRMCAIINIPSVLPKWLPVEPEYAKRCVANPRP